MYIIQRWFIYFEEKDIRKRAETASEKLEHIPDKRAMSDLLFHVARRFSLEIGASDSTTG